MLTLHQPTLPSLSQRLSIPITSILLLDLINFVNVPSTFTDVTQSCLISTTCHSYYVHFPFTEVDCDEADEIRRWFSGKHSHVDCMIIKLELYQ